jgi:hypothetical protein
MNLIHRWLIVDPNSLPKRLEAAGFADVHVDANQYAFRFRARRVKKPNRTATAG